MNYAFTGPSKLIEGEDLVRAMVLALDPEPTMIITGAAHGVDTIVCLAALQAWPDAEHMVVVPAAPHNEQLVRDLQKPSLALEGRKLMILPVPPGDNPSQAYRARNAVMVELADCLVAVLRRPVYYRSGEWMTLNMALKQQMWIRKVVLT